ncbi:MAG TPA: hypothetical protein VJ935_09675 [Acidimicrobiia bacterium]|nr:hypothetical protein [Acidimicrobiia bacterium]
MTGDGFVVASASNRAGPLHSTITDLFLDATYGSGTRFTLQPLPRLEVLSWIFLVISLVLLVVLTVGLIRFLGEVRSGRRARDESPSRRGLMRALPWVVTLLFGWYTLYSPLTLYLPAWFPDLWPTTGGAVLMGILTLGIAFRVATAFFPRRAGHRTSVGPPLPERIESRPTRNWAFLIPYIDDAGAVGSFPGDPICRLRTTADVTED